MERPFANIDYPEISRLSDEMSALKHEILYKIGETDSLYAVGARMYQNDEGKASRFIAECFDQCHHSSFLQFFGIDLVLKIIHFRLELIRNPLRMVEKPGCELPTHYWYYQGGPRPTK
jgi:hypothetical protein